MKRSTVDAARGKWRGILLSFGAPADALKGKHCPCPFCGGKDRFRFDDKEGSGSFICEQCGAGKGFEFLKRLKGWEFKEAAWEVDKLLGQADLPTDRIRPAIDPAKARRKMADLWNEAVPITVGDPVSLYLEARRVPLPQNRDCVRYMPRCPVPNEVGCRPAMLAKVCGVDGAGVQLHRTFLTPQGAKAPIDQPRATMPGCIPEGAAIRLAMHGERLGIAEGIETALAATARFDMPVWAAINSTMLAKWTPPETVREVLIFGDNDPKFGGQAAAFALAHRLAVKGVLVTPMIPPQAGTDWADAA